MNLFWKLIKIIVFFLSLVGMVGFVRAIGHWFGKIPFSSAPFLSFLAGGVFYFFLWLVYLSRREGFWRTLEHELTHALFSILSFKRVHSLSASRRRGGTIRVEGGNTLIALAPYFFPLLTSVFILLKPLVNSNFQIYLNFLIGLSYIFHLTNVVQEFHPGQPDLQVSGFVFSLVVVLFLNILIFGVVVVLAGTDFNSMLQFVKEGIALSGKNLVYLYRSAAAMITHPR